jgi:alkyl sulfatase BDS1-like metallo-beta-lactamase superfamily hydrolase
VTLIPPSDTIGGQGQATDMQMIDGIDVNFQLTPGTEAPAEMNIYFPSYRALCAAENATHTMHNILTLRGAQVRDPAIWARYLDDTIQLFGSNTDVMFAQHHWPTWGAEQINAFLADQRDMYKYINDQTLRLLNRGLAPMEIAETLKTLPPALARKWYNRDYYGSMSHNVRAVYQRYLGFYDGNPSHLDPLPPVDAARHYVEFMGGADKVLEKARDSFKRGEYRWVAQVMDHVVFADPNNSQARELEADALEQLGYQTENGTWRNEMLMGAFELRNGVPQIPALNATSPDTLKAMPLDMFFSYMGIRLNGEKASTVPEMVLNWHFTDTNQKYAVTLRNSALTFRHDAQSAKAAATMTLTRKGLDEILTRNTSFVNEINAGRMRIDGDAQKFQQLFALLDNFQLMFNIVTPRGE